MQKYTRKKLLELPSRPWSLTAKYSSLIIFPSNKKHDCGWGGITVIGVRDMVPIEIITENSDDIFIDGAHSVDCLHKSKAMHFWSRSSVFHVMHALSSIEIKMIGK